MATMPGIVSPPGIAARPDFRPVAGYDAVRSSDRHRRTISAQTRAEDDELNIRERKELIATSRDASRNVSLLAWMVRHHLAYVAEAKFQARTKDDGFNAELVAFITDRGRAGSFDASGRFNIEEAFRLLEARAVLDGDCGFQKLRSGRVLAIEGDRVAEPTSGKPPEMMAPDRTWVKGIEINAQGRPLNYHVCERDGATLKPGVTVPAYSMLWHSYPCFRFDAVRGVSPLASALNSIRDLYESWLYNLIKAKLHAIFGLAISKEAGGASTVAGLPVTETEVVGTQSSDSTGNATNETKKQWVQPGAPAIVELRPGETINTFESKAPSAEFQSYSDLMIRVSLLALDIPYIFFDQLKGSYSVHRTVWLQYNRFCAPKRDRLRSIRNQWTVWQIVAAVNDDSLSLPRGWTMADVLWQWQDPGVPWVDLQAEMNAAEKSITLGIDSPQRIATSRGEDFKTIVDETAEAIAYARSKGVKLAYDLAAPEPKQPDAMNPDTQEMPQ